MYKSQSTVWSKFNIRPRGNRDQPWQVLWPGSRDTPQPPICLDPQLQVAHTSSSRLLSLWKALLSAAGSSNHWIRSQQEVSTKPRQEWCVCCALAQLVSRCSLCLNDVHCSHHRTCAFCPNSLDCLPWPTPGQTCFYTCAPPILP